MAKEYDSLNTTTMPVIALRGLTVFPNVLIHFEVAREAWELLGVQVSCHCWFSCGNAIPLTLVHPSFYCFTGVPDLYPMFVCECLSQSAAG